MTGLIRGFTLAAAATLVLSAMPERAQAMSPVTPGAAPAATASPDSLILVRGGFHGGGFHGGGFHGGWHGGGGFHGGGFRYGGFHHYGGYRYGYVRHFHHRHFFYGGGYYPYYYGYYHHPHCRVIWTYYGPRRVCGWRHWHRRHHWRYYW